MQTSFGYNIIRDGEVAERSNAAVLKTVEGQPSQGSNPCLSAKLFLRPHTVTPYSFQMQKIKFKAAMTYLIIIIICLAWLSGKILDYTAQRRVQDMYARDHQGVIDGLQSITILQGKSHAILFVHGFLDSPAIFSDLVHDIKDKVNSDIYVPLLPFHGRNLETAAQFCNTVILDSLDRTINTLTKQYASLTIVGMSYGGALVTRLLSENKIPPDVQIILYAPSFYIKTNTWFGRIEAHLYGVWRKYCNYAALGCTFPGYASGDATARPMFEKEKSLQYTVIPALLQLYKFDQENRHELGTIHRPYDIIMAEDDNRVSCPDIKKVCAANQSYCHLYTFPTGKHFLLWGANKKKFENLLVKLVTTRQAP